MFDYEQYLRLDKFPHIWCSGCGHGIVLKSLLRAIDKLGLKKDEICVVSGIGCSSRTPGYVDFNTLHTTHGRALTFATGIKMARPELHVIVITGDGDCTAIGGNHFIHAARRNIDITVIVENNMIYGMTGGQASPTTPENARSSTSAYGAIDPVFDISGLAQAAGASYVARSTAYDAIKAERFIRRALEIKGFSVVEVLSQCPTAFGRYNRMRSPVEMMQWYKNNTIPIERARKLSPEEMEGKMTTGVLFEHPDPKEYTEGYARLRRQAKAQFRLEGDSRNKLDEDDKRIHHPAPLQQDRIEVRLSGSGGQGMILAGVILGEAAAIFDDRHAAQTQSYGPEARGGASMSDVVITNEEIDFPKATELDVLVALTQEAADRYASRVKKGGLVIIEKEVVRKPPRGDFCLVALPMLSAARDTLGRALVANIVALGALVELTGVVSKEAIKDATLSRVPRGTERLNLNALNAGFELARLYKENSLEAKDKEADLCAQIKSGR